MKLYICGNGFDLHHGYKTGYREYREFLIKYYSHAYFKFEEFEYLDFCLSDKWCDLERSLTINYEECISDAISEYYPNLNDDSDSRWYRLDIDLEEQTKFIYDFTGKYFLEWLNQIDFSNTNNKMSLDKSALFITFNYTNTLEKVYDIDKDNIFHIHGNLDLVGYQNILDWVIPSFSTIEEAEVLEQVQVDEINNNTVRTHIQFGSIDNNAETINLELENKYGQDDFYAVSIEPAIDHIIGFSHAASKNLEKNYERLTSFISRKNINEVIILGHSIMGGDYAYYLEVIIPKLKNCNWTFYWHSLDDNKIVNKFIESFSLENFCLRKW